MSRPTKLFATLAIAALTLTPSAVSGQLREGDIVARIDSLRPLVEQARTEAAAAAARQRERGRAAAALGPSVDTFFVGGLRVLALEEDAARARELFHEAWADRFGLFEDRNPGPVVIVFQDLRDAEQIFVDSGTEPRVVTTRTWRSRDETLASVGNAIAGVIEAELAGSEIRRWASGDVLAPRDLARVYRALATAPSASVRECLGGVVAACTTSLGLDLDEATPPLGTWYTPEERRDLVMSRFSRSSLILGPPYVACVDALDYAVCDLMLEFNNDGGRQAWTPLAGSIRSSVVSFAIARGGVGAWERLLEGRDARPADALSHAAGIPLDRLIGEWRARVIESRPEAHAGLGGAVGMTLMWILFFAGLATRSTRWRLG